MTRRHLIAVRALFAVALALATTGCSQPSPASPPASPQAAPTTASAAKPAVAPASPTTAPAAQASPTGKAQFPQPGKPITVIVPWGAGGGADVAARIVVAGMEKVLGVPIQVSNKEGASSQVGLTEASKAQPDGYTIAVTVFPTAITTYLDPARNAAYNRQSFIQVASHSYDYYSPVVSAASAYQTLKDLEEYGKAQPGRLKIGVSGLQGGSHLAAAQWAKKAGLQPTYVPFNSSAEVFTAILGGHVDVGFQGAATLIGPTKAGEARVLALGAAERSDQFPGVPTMRELGYGESPLAVYGFVVPAGTPMEIVNILAEATKKSIESSEVRQKLDGLTLSVRYLGPAEFSRHWDETEAMLKPLLAELASQ